MNVRNIVALAGWFIILGSNAHAEVVKVAGSGGMIPLVTRLAQAFMKNEPGSAIDVNQKSLGKEGGVLALKKDVIDIALLASLEAKDKELPLALTPIAVVPGVFAVHPGVKVKALTSRQVCDIYSGQITNWKQVGGRDAPVVVLTRPENESTKIAVRQGLGCFSTLKESPTAIMVEKSPEMAALIPKTPNSIGMVNSVAVAEAKGSMVPLVLDGRDVSQSGKNWPILHRFYLATGKKPKEAATRFIRFVKSAEGQKIIKQEKAYPVQ